VLKLEAACASTVQVVALPLHCGAQLSLVQSTL
jgi:hypothetical protein